MTLGKKVALKGLHVVNIRGRQYVYAWRGGPRIYSPLGSPEFHAEYNEAVKPKAPVGRAHTIAGLILDFRASARFRTRMSVSTRRDHERYFDRIVDEFGAAPIAAFNDPRIQSDIRRWHEAIPGDRQADKAILSLGLILQFGMQEGKLTYNAAAVVPKRYEREPDPTPWTDEELQRFYAVASVEVARAVRLGELTGLARADLAGLTWAEINLRWIERRRAKSHITSKKGWIARIPIYPELRTFLDSIPRDPEREHVLANASGARWQADWLGKCIREVCKVLRIEKTPHDLRATFATRLYRMGFKDEAVADMLGWSRETVQHVRTHYVDEETIFEARVLDFDAASRDKK